MLTTKYLKSVTWSNFFAQFSEQIALAAAPLIAVLLFNATTSDTAWLQTIQTLPFLICALPAGLIVDRFSRRNIMMTVELIRLMMLSTLLLLLILKILTFPTLLILGFIAAIGTVCYSIAMPAYIPTITTPENLLNTNRSLELVRSIAFSAGPALCGVVVAYLGMALTYIIAILFSLFTLQFLRQLPHDIIIKESLVKPRSLTQSIGSNWRFIYHNAYLRPILFTALFFNTSWFMIQGIFVAYAIYHLQWQAQDVGIILGTYGIGMLLGAFVVKPLSAKMPLGLMIMLGPICGLTAAMMILLTLNFPFVCLARFGYLLLGFGPTIWVITTLSLRQTITPTEIMGSVNALILTVSSGTKPLGAMIAGLLTAQFNVQVTLTIALIGFIIQFLIILFSKIPTLKNYPINYQTITLEPSDNIPKKLIESSVSMSFKKNVVTDSNN